MQGEEGNKKPKKMLAKAVSFQWKGKPQKMARDGTSQPAQFNTFFSGNLPLSTLTSSFKVLEN
jgi:hypothetical protein